MNHAIQSAPAGRVFASPLAKRLAKMGNLDLSLLKGSGPYGRIVKADIEAALRSGTGVAAPKSASAPAAPPLLPASGDFEEIPHSSMRKVIAKRLTEAKQTVPHFYLTLDVELDRLLEVRKQINARFPDVKISVNDFVIKAVALALRKVPGCNSAWTDTAVRRFKTVDVSVAVATPNGLITPIVRDADKKGVGQISAEMKDFGARAKAGKLMPEEYQGGGFTISNLGMFGIKQFEAIINPPQSCILAVGAGGERPVVKNGQLAIANVMSVTLSVDHRVVDGALGAEFLQAFRGLIEEPLAMML